LLLTELTAFYPYALYKYTSGASNATDTLRLRQAQLSHVLQQSPLAVVHTDLVNYVFLIFFPVSPSPLHLFPLTSGVRRILDWRGDLTPSILAIFF